MKKTTLPMLALALTVSASTASADVSCYMFNDNSGGRCTGTIGSRNLSGFAMFDVYSNLHIFSFYYPDSNGNWNYKSCYNLSAEPDYARIHSMAQALVGVPTPAASTTEGAYASFEVSFGSNGRCYEFRVWRYAY
jgi:hypothetical protein